MKSLFFVFIIATLASTSASTYAAQVNSEVERKEAAASPEATLKSLATPHIGAHPAQIVEDYVHIRTLFIPPDDTISTHRKSNTVIFFKQLSNTQKQIMVQKFGVQSDDQWCLAAHLSENPGTMSVKTYCPAQALQYDNDTTTLNNQRFAIFAERKLYGASLALVLKLRGYRCSPEEIGKFLDEEAEEAARENPNAPAASAE